MALAAVAPDRAPRAVVWADAAKGVCILLVVLHHIVGKHYLVVLPESLAWLGSSWLTLTYALKPVRLPLFFLISGFFAAKAIDRPWREVWPTRVGNLYYLYALWLSIHAVLFANLTQLGMNRTQNAIELLLDLVVASTGVWYLYALVAYFVAARLMRRLDPRTVVMAAAALALVVPWLDIAAVNRAALLQHFVYFALGAFFPAAVVRMTQLKRAHATRLAVVAVLLTVLGSIANVGSAMMVLPVSLVGVPCAVRAAVALARLPALADPLAQLGRRTLPIYVLHVPVLAVVHLFVAPWFAFAESWLAVATVAVYPVALVLLVTLACLGLQWVLESVGAKTLFNGPFTRPQPVRPASITTSDPRALSTN